MVVGDRGAALLPSLRSVVVAMMVMVNMVIKMAHKKMMVMHCGVEGKERVRCMKVREENRRKKRNSKQKSAVEHSATLLYYTHVLVPTHT